MEQAGGEWRKGRRVRSRTNTWRASGLLMFIRRAGATGRQIPRKAVRGIAFVVRDRWSTVRAAEPPGDVLLLAFAQYADVVAPRAVVRVETLPSADDSGLHRVWVGDVERVAIETWVAETLPMNTIVEVFDRAPAA